MAMAPSPPMQSKTAEETNNITIKKRLGSSQDQVSIAPLVKDFLAGTKSTFWSCGEMSMAPNSPMQWQTDADKINTTINLN